MSATLVDTLPIWILLTGAGVLSLGSRTVKSTPAWGPLTLLLILLAGVSLHSSVSSSLVTTTSNDVSSNEGVTADAMHSWRLVWQSIALAVGFLVVLMTLDEADADDERTSSASSGVRYALVACSIAGLCGLACSSTLWGLFAAGRLCFWPLLLGFRRAEGPSVENPGVSSSGRILSNVFWMKMLASVSRNPSTQAGAHETGDPVIMLVWREAWSMVLMLVGLAILAAWTGCTSLSLAELRAFQPEAQQSAIGGIAGVLLVIVGAGWTIPLHLETLDIAERGNPASSAWLLSVQSLSAVMTVGTAAVGTSLGRFVPAETMLIVFAGWAFVLGSFIVRRQIHLRRWLAALVLAQSGWWMTSIALAVAQKNMEEFAPVVALMYPHNLSVAPYLMIADLTAILGFSAICRFVLNGERELTYLDDLRGMLRQQPLAAGLAAVSLLSLLGLPLTAGFWGRWQIVCGVWSVQLIQPRTGLPAVHGGFVVLAFVAVWSQIVVMQAIWQPLRMILFEAPAGRIATKERQAALSVAILAAFIIVGIGLMPDALLRELRQIVSL
ncbi:MAG: proton-conducting transporter membrane subunit [Planctomycetaceae bacterium]